MVLNKILKKKRPRGQPSMSRFLFRAAYRRLGRAILRVAVWPGTVLKKLGYFSVQMVIKGQQRALEYWGKVRRMRQTLITEYLCNCDLCRLRRGPPQGQ